MPVGKCKTTLTAKRKEGRNREQEDTQRSGLKEIKRKSKKEENTENTQKGKT